MIKGVPPPATIQEEYLAAILSELQAANELLATLLAQGLPPSPPAGEVALKEPAKKPARRTRRK